MPVLPTTKPIMVPPFCVDSDEKRGTQEKEEAFEIVDYEVPTTWPGYDVDVPPTWPGYDVSDETLADIAGILAAVDREELEGILAAEEREREREEGLYRGFWNSSPMDGTDFDPEVEKGVESPRIEKEVVWDKGVFHVPEIPMKTDCKRQRHYIARQEKVFKEINVWERVSCLFANVAGVNLPLDPGELFPLSLSGKIQMDELTIWIQASLKSKKDLEELLKLVRKVVEANPNPRLGGDYRVAMHVLMITQNTDSYGNRLCLRRRQELDSLRGNDESNVVDSLSARGNDKSNVFESIYVSRTALQGICESELSARKDTNLFAPWLARPLQTLPPTILSRISAFFSASRKTIQPPVPADVYIIRKGSEVIQPYSRLN